MGGHNKNSKLSPSLSKTSVDQLIGCCFVSLPRHCHILHLAKKVNKLGIRSRLDLTNGSGQPGSNSTHVGSGQKTSHPKWVTQLITLTWSFKGRVKTRLTHIFTHEKNIYIKNENKLDPIVQNYHLVFFVFLSIQIREHINKNTHK